MTNWNNCNHGTRVATVNVRTGNGCGCDNCETFTIYRNNGGTRDRDFDDFNNSWSTSRRTGAGTAWTSDRCCRHCGC